MADLPFNTKLDFTDGLLDAIHLTSTPRKYFGANGDAFEIVSYGTIPLKNDYSITENREYVIKHLETGRFFKIESTYDSWGGESGLDNIREVLPVTKTITVYE